MTLICSVIGVKPFLTGFSLMGVNEPLSEGNLEVFIISPLINFLTLTVLLFYASKQRLFTKVNLLLIITSSH